MKNCLEFMKNYICTFEFWGGMLMQLSITTHFHFSFIEACMLGGGYGIFIASYLTKKGQPFIINFSLSPVPQENSTSVPV